MTSRRRRLPLRHVVTAAAVGVIAWVIATVARQSEPDDTIAPGPVTARPPDAPAASAAAGPAAMAAVATAPSIADAATAVAVRTVTGPGIAPLPIADGPPVRIEPPAKPKPPLPPVAMRRLMPILMETTAEFTAGDIRVRLPGVGVVAADEVCRDREGTEWPCGRRALAGVRALVRGRAVDCPLPEKIKRGSFVADCSIAGADLAERIVASGWARALDREGRLGEAERRAEAQGLGLSGPAIRPPVDPFPDPGDVPPDTTTARPPVGREGPDGAPR